jgi:hypothetical protein
MILPPPYTFSQPEGSRALRNSERSEGDTEEKRESKKNNNSYFFFLRKSAGNENKYLYSQS